MKILDYSVTKKDNFIIRGKIMEPDIDAKATIIYSPCFTCTMNYTSNLRLSEILVSYGFRLVRYDYIGSGISDGEFKNVRYENQVDDLEAVVTYVRNHYKEEIILLGHSLGSITSLIVASKNNIMRIISLAAPYTFQGLMNRINEFSALYQLDDHYLIKVGNQEIMVRKDYVSRKYDSSYDSILRDYKGISLSIHSKSDMVAPYKGAEKFNEIRGHLGTLVDYQGDHMISGRNIQKQIGEVINKWYEETAS